MTLYILKSSALLLVLLSVYKLWLENEKMHHFNRLYLLGSLIFSLIIPLGFSTFKTKSSNTLSQFQLDEIVLTNSDQLNSISENKFLTTLLITTYALVFLVLSIRYIMNLNSFYKKIKHNEHQYINGNKVILIQEAILPHSFLNSIFIYENDFKNNTIDTELIVHEIAHIRQKHSLDILFIEFLQILFWFNPLLFLYKNAIQLNHEFLADEKVNSQFNSISYYQNLLVKMASDKRKVALASSINFKITKKRFIMMTKKESRTRIIVKTTVVGFVYSILFFAFNTESPAQEITKVPQQAIYGNTYKTSEIEHQPEFPGGMMNFYKFVGANFKMPKEAVENKITGKAFVSFIVEKDGTLTNLKLIRGVGYGTDEEIMRVLKASPKWNPGKIADSPIRVSYKLPITITQN